MKEFICLFVLLVVGFFLYRKSKQVSRVHVIEAKTKLVETPPKETLELTSNFVKPNNAFHHVFRNVSRNLSSQSKLSLSGQGIERFYSQATVEEPLYAYVKQLIEKAIQKFAKLKPGIDFYLKDITEIYQQVDSHGNQRYIAKCFIYDIRNFYQLKLLVDVIIISGTMYVNYLGEDFSSVNNVLNRYDYRIDDAGYMMKRNMIRDNMKEIVDGYYRQYYNIIGYDESPIDYSHYISKLNVVHNCDISELSNYYVPPEIPSLYDPRFGKKDELSWNEFGIQQPTGDRFQINNNSTVRQPNIPLDSPGSNPYTRSYEGDYSFLQSVGLGNGGVVVTSSHFM